MSMRFAAHLLPRRCASGAARRSPATPGGAPAKVSNHVFLGNISEDEKIDLLQRARVFLHTPVQSSDGGFEGFGIVYLEAAAAGVAAIGTTGCGAEDAIVQGETGALVAPEPGAVAEALAHLLAAEALRERMGEAARLRLLHGFTEAQVQKSLREAYQSLLGRRPS